MQKKDSGYRMTNKEKRPKRNTRRRKLELGKKHRALHNSWRCGRTVGFLKRRWRLKSFCRLATRSVAPKY